MFPEPDDEQIRTLLEKHHLPSSGDVERATKEGVPTFVRLIGDYCVRVLKNDEYQSDIYTEAVAVPAVYAVGVLTPELLAFDTEMDVVSSEVTIFRRAEGDSLGAIRPFPGSKSIYLEVAREAAKWDRLVTSVDDPNGWLDVPETIDLSDALKGAREAMTASDVAWVEGLVRRVENITSPVSRFVHNDLHALNIMIANDRLSGVIDWGDAGWGDPALNFTSFPAEYLPDALTEFGDEDYELIGSCLREVVGYALYCIGEGKPADGAALQIGQKRWASLLSLWDQPLTAAWRDWVKDPPNLRKDQ